MYVKVGLSRRDFLRTAGGALAVASFPRLARADDTPEELVKRLYGALTDAQKKEMCFGWDHANRTRVGNNWAIVPHRIGKFFTGDQQEIVRDIFKGLVSGDGWDRFQKQMKDDYGGFDKYHVALFGDPEKGKYEWVMTGRHLTLRCDGGSNSEAAFGGPIFYGHAVEFNEKPDHPGNVFWPQSVLANKVFSSLDGKQQEKALLEKSPPDDPKCIALRKEGHFDGIPVEELSKDQKGLVEKVMRELLAPYRASDGETTMKYVKSNGGLDKIHLAFYKEGDLGNDGIWDRWMLQGPNLSWYFRGSPHVHVWVNIAAKA